MDARHKPDMVNYWPEAVVPAIQPAVQPLPIVSSSLRTISVSNFLEHFSTEDPNRYFDDNTHKGAYTDTGFSRLLPTAGFRVVDSEPRFITLRMQSCRPKAGWMVSLYLHLPLRPFAGQFLTIAERTGPVEASNVAR